jgi:phosphonate transport system substrate-binding protein
MVSRRKFLGLGLLGFLVACTSNDTSGSIQPLTVGVISYGEGDQSLERYEGLKEHLARELQTIIQVEPAFNEVQAVQQIQQEVWDIVLASPGLSAIAISQARYLPLLPRGMGTQERSLIIVRDDSPAKAIGDLAGKAIALGQEGSATGYYLPIFNLYGLTLSEVRLAPTPKTVLEWVEKGETAAGALSLAEFEALRSEFSQTKFRILFRDVHTVPEGAVLISPNVDRTLQEQVKQALESAPPDVIRNAEYIPNVDPPDYGYLIQVVKRVRPIAQRIREKPAPLY